MHPKHTYKLLRPHGNTYLAWETHGNLWFIIRKGGGNTASKSVRESATGWETITYNTFVASSTNKETQLSTRFGPTSEMHKTASGSSYMSRLRRRPSPPSLPLSLFLYIYLSISADILIYKYIYIFLGAKESHIRA